MLVSPCEERSRRQHRTHAVCSPDRCWVSTGLGTPERGRRPPRAKADVLEADLVPADLRDRPRPPHGRAQDQGMLPAHGRYEVSAKVRSLLQNEATFRGETPPGSLAPPSQNGGGTRCYRDGPRASGGGASGLHSGATDRVEATSSPVVVRVAVSLAGRAAAGALASAGAGASGRAGVAPARMAAAEVARLDASGHSGLAW